MTTVRIAIVGGGPGGLYLAALAKQLDPRREVTVWERNAPDDTFGFGVVFSDETLGGIAAADPVLFAAVERSFARWSDVDVVHRGRTVTSGGHGFAAINRRVLLGLLQQRCNDVGVDVRYRTPAPDVAELSAAYDLVVAADGANSAVRTQFADVFRPSLDTRSARYMWLGTDKVFDAFTFFVVDTPHGPMQVHAYPFDADRSTFIVEVNEATWRAAGFDAAHSETGAGANLPPGVSDSAGIARLAEIFAPYLDGGRLIANNSKWLRFTTVRNLTWRHGNVVLLGDAAHTAHFSIGSGTKLAMEDALSLAACLQENTHSGDTDVATALAAYETERRPVVESTQRAAQASLEWFENVAHVAGQETPQFAFGLMTRSRRVTCDNLRLRDPSYVADVERWFDRQVTPGPDVGERAPVPPLFQPFDLGGVRLKNRVVTAPIATQTARDGRPGEEESLWLTSAALGGSALVLAGSVAVSAEGRAGERCSGLYADSHTAEWRAIVERIHRLSSGLVGVQLTHAGGGTAGVLAEFVAATRRAAEAGFDVLELQAGHGHLLSRLISPLTNDGDLTSRLRFPLEVLEAVRAAWPADKPVVVRISAVDWAPGGTTLDDAVAIAHACAEHGAAAIDVSSGEVVPHAKPAYGRTYQTPFAERIRNVVGVPTIAVGGISTQDDATSIVLAGRADLVAIGRAALHDPAWALHAAAEIGYRGPGAEWPEHYRAGSAPPLGPRDERLRPRLTLAGVGAPAVHRRWRGVPTYEKTG